MQKEQYFCMSALILMVPLGFADFHKEKDNLKCPIVFMNKINEVF